MFSLGILTCGWIELRTTQGAQIVDRPSEEEIAEETRIISEQGEPEQGYQGQQGHHGHQKTAGHHGKRGQGSR